jgi:hypothetical protein
MITRLLEEANADADHEGFCDGCDQLVDDVGDATLLHADLVNFHPDTVNFREVHADLVNFHPDTVNFETAGNKAFDKVIVAISIDVHLILAVLVRIVMCMEPLMVWIVMCMEPLLVWIVVCMDAWSRRS